MMTSSYKIWAHEAAVGVGETALEHEEEGD